MVGVNRVAQAKAIGRQRYDEDEWITDCGKQGKNPQTSIYGYQETVQSDDFGAYSWGAVTKDSTQRKHVCLHPSTLAFAVYLPIDVV